MGGRWRYKLIVSLKYRNLHYKDTQIMGGRWRYKLIVSLKYVQFYATKIHKLWVDIVSLKKKSLYTTKIQKLWVDVGVTNLQCL